MDNYYLQVVKSSEKPKWPRPEEELEISSQNLGGGYTQYWAYEEGVGRDNLSPAELLANEHSTNKPAILIDATDERNPDTRKEHYLTLVVTKDGHAWGKTESSLANLEDNVNTLLDFAKEHFNINVEHFMTTSNVPEEVEKKLDEIENQNDSEEDWKEGNGKEVSPVPERYGASTGKEVGFSDSDDPWQGIKKVGSNKPSGLPVNPSFPKGSIGVGTFKPSDKGSSKFWMLIPVVVILLVFGGTLLFKGQGLSRIKSLNLGGVFSSPTPTPAPLPTPTPTPTPEVKREEVKVRVLNGTTKAGAAATLKEQLVKKGWDVIKTGNAKNQKLEQTTVSVKKDLKQVLETMVEDLKEDFEATTGADLDEKDTVDVEVAIGKK